MLSCAPGRGCRFLGRPHAKGASPGVQSVAEKKKEVADDDVLALLGDECHQATKSWQLTSLQAGRPHAFGPPKHLTSSQYMCCRTCVHGVHLSAAMSCN